MSSYIKKTSSDFFVPTEHTGKVLAAGLRFLPDALFCFPMDREGNIVDVKAEGCILSEMREMLAAIAPWVREGSYHKWVYRWPTAQAEEKLARQVASMLSSKQKGQEDGLAQKLAQIEGKLGRPSTGNSARRCSPP